MHLLMHLRMTGTLLYDPAAGPAAYARALRARRRPRLTFVDPRRFGTGELALGTAALEAFFAARLGVEPFGASSRPSACARRRAPPRAGQGLPARPAAGRRRGQHLRRRGALPRAHPPAAPGRAPDPRAARARCATASWPSLRAGMAAERRLDRRLPPPRRGARLLPGPVPRPPPGGEPCPAAARRSSRWLRPVAHLCLRALSAEASPSPGVERRATGPAGDGLTFGGPPHGAKRPPPPPALPRKRRLPPRNRSAPPAGPGARPRARRP